MGIAHPLTAVFAIHSFPALAKFGGETSLSVGLSHIASERGGQIVSVLFEPWTH